MDTVSVTLFPATVQNKQVAKNTSCSALTIEFPTTLLPIILVLAVFSISASRGDDDEVMLNVLRYQLTY